MERLCTTYPNVCFITGHATAAFGEVTKRVDNLFICTCTFHPWGQTVSCILQAGGVPIFADIDPVTLTMDPARIEPLITEHTKAIVLVNIFGIPADMDAIMAIAERRPNVDKA